MVRKLVLACLLLVIAGGIFIWLNRGPMPKPVDLTPEPEAPPAAKAGIPSEEEKTPGPKEELIEDFSFAHTDPETGKLLYKFSARQAFPVKDAEGKIIKLKIEEPVITLYPGGGGEMTVTARGGEISFSGVSGETEAAVFSSSDALERKGFLEGDVRMETGDGMTAYLDEVHWDSGLSKMYSAGPVKVESAEFEMTGLGMETRDSMNVFAVNRNVKVTIKKAGGEALKIFKGKSKGDIIITCDKKLILDRAAGSAEFNENVETSQGGFSLKSKLLKIDFAKQKGTGARSLSLDRLSARENVVVNGPDYNAAGDRLSYDARQDMAVITGIDTLARLWREADFVESRTIQFFPATNEIRTPEAGMLRIFSKEDAKRKKTSRTITWKGSMRFDSLKNSAHFEKDVKIDDGLSTLTSQRTDVQFETRKSAEGKGEIALARIVAEKDVSYVEGEREISGDRLVFDKNKEIFTVYSADQSRVVIGKDTLTAQEIFYDKESEITTAKGKGSLTIIPEEAEKDMSPVRITWEESMKFHAKKNFAEFNKSVRMKKNNEVLEADYVKPVFSQQGARKKIESVFARGNVHSRDEKKEIRCEVLEHREGSRTRLTGSPASAKIGEAVLDAPIITFFPSTNRVIAEGAGRLTMRHTPDEKDPLPKKTVATWTEKMIYVGNESFAEFFENVDLLRVEGGSVTSRLQSDYLKLLFKGGQELEVSSIQEITKAIATSRRNGGVVFRREGVRGEGNYLLWEKDKGEVSLTGKPFATLVEKDRNIAADKFRFFDRENRIQAEGQHSMTLWPGAE